MFFKAIKVDVEASDSATLVGELAKFQEKFNADSIVLIKRIGEKILLVSSIGPLLKQSLYRESTTLFEYTERQLSLLKRVVTIPILAKSASERYFLCAILSIRYAFFATKFSVADSLAIRALIARHEMEEVENQRDLLHSTVSSVPLGVTSSNPFEAMLKHLILLYKCSGGSIWEFHTGYMDEKHECLTLEFAWGHSSSEYKIRCLTEKRGLMWRVMKANDPKILHVHRVGRSDLVNKHLLETVFRDPALLIRLEVNGRIYGVACLNGFKNSDIYSQTHLLTAFESIAALALHNKQLESDRNALRHITGELLPHIACGSIAEACMSASTNLRNLVKCQAVSIFLLSETGDGRVRLQLSGVDIDPRFSASRATAAFLEGKPTYYPVTRDSLTGTVFLTRQPLVTHSVSSMPGNSQIYREIDDTSNDTWVAVPIFDIQSRSIGVIRCSGKETTLDGKPSPYVFDAHDIQIIQYYSQTLSPIIDSIQSVGKLEQVNNRLAETERYRDHETKGPLASIAFNAEFVKRYLHDDGVPSKEAKLEDIIADTETCFFLLRAPGIPSATEFERSKTLVSLNKLVSDLRQFLQRQINARADIRSEKGADGFYYDLPTTPMMQVTSSGRVRPVIGNRQLLQRALYNLGMNAVKYGLPKGKLRIALSEDKSADFAHIDFEDTGIGIEEEDVPRLFENGFRGEKVKNAYPGDGIGLFLTKSILEIHGGRLELISRSDPTIFRASIPIPDEELPDSEIDSAILRFDIPQRIT